MANTIKTDDKDPSLSVEPPFTGRDRLCLEILVNYGNES